MDPVDDKFIDIDEVLRKKNPGLYRVLPSFLIKYLKKIAHQDELNQAINNQKQKLGLEFVDGILSDMGISYKSYGTENIPRSGRFIFASNHPLGGLDGLVIINETGKHFPCVRFVVNDLLRHVKNMDSVFVPVNKHGKQSVDYARKIEDAYQSNDQILYFPAGLCSRKINGKFTDLPWQKNFITKAIKYQRDIIPIYFSGQNSSFFYNLARLRKILGIKANIEMLYLVDEMYKQQNKNLKLVYGKPIPYTMFDRTKSPAEWTSYVRELVYSMKIV
jgi:putative hemolysin